MRHLPYISREPSDAYEIYFKTAAVDYNGGHVKQSMKRAESSGRSVDLGDIEPEPEYTHIPPHVLCLASETSGSDGHFFLVDTKKGTITVYNLGGHHFIGPGSFDFEVET